MKRLLEKILTENTIIGVIWAMLALILQYAIVFITLTTNPSDFSSKKRFKECLIPYNLYVIGAEKIVHGVYYLYDQIPDKDNN